MPLNHDPESLPEEVRPIAKKTIAVRTRNASIIEQLESIGISFEVGGAKIDYFMHGLVDAGVLTEGQHWAIQLNWEEELQDQLERAVRSVKEQQARYKQEQANAAKQAPSSPLVLPPGADPNRKLFVPPGLGNA